MFKPLHTAGPNDTQHAERASPAPPAPPASQPHRLFPNAHDVSVLVRPGLVSIANAIPLGAIAIESMSPRPDQRKA